MKIDTMFLSLKDAVDVAVREFGADREMAEIEFEQKCYVTDDQYEIGYYDGMEAALDAVKAKMNE